VGHGGPKRARSWKRRTEPRKAYSAWRSPLLGGILQRFSDTYNEESPSGTGAKIWCRARAPRCGGWPIEHGAIEIYDRARFFAVTGKSTGIAAITDHQLDIEALITNLEDGRHSSRACVVPELIPYGTQHNTLVSLAGTMWRRGMSPEAIDAALQTTNARQCERPGTPEDIRKIVESMQRWQR
jgi:hypothetical protein